MADSLATRTIYVRNLNEKLSSTAIKQKLTTLFQSSGFRIDDVRTHKNLRLKGQAFVILHDSTSVSDFVEKFNTKMLLGKPMNVQVARRDSDEVMRQSLTYKKFDSYLKKERSSRLLKRKETKLAVANRKRKLDDESTTEDVSNKRMKETEKPVPNKIILITSLSKATTEQDLQDIFGVFDGFLNVNLVSARNLALVEFQNEENSILCMNKLGEVVKIKDQDCTMVFAKK